MKELLARILDTCGGLDRRNAYERVRATIVNGGRFFPLKGVAQNASSRQKTAWLQEERSLVLPYGGPGQRAMFTSARMVVGLITGQLSENALRERD